MPDRSSRHALQENRLARLARRAVDLYGIENARLTRLGASDNAVFRVETAENQRFALRLHTAERHTTSTLESELYWLDHLGGAALPIPRPVQSPFGAWVVLLAEHGEPPLPCTMLRWLDGEVLGERLSVDQSKHLGALLAKLHLHTERFTPPADFDRPSYTFDHFVRCWHDLSSTLEVHRTPRDHIDTIELGLAACAGLVEPMEEVPGGYGIIHADVHPGNLLAHEDELLLIDFDRCGWGAYLFDIAESVLDMEAPERDAFFDGYTLHRTLPPKYEPHLKALVCLAALENLAFLAKRPHELTFVMEALPHVADALSRVRGA